MWLLDYLALLTPPTVRVYSPLHYRSRMVICGGKETEANWMQYLIEQEGQDLQWTCPWWQCAPPTIRSPGCDHVVLMGFRFTTLYKPLRILRQFGYKQRIPKNGRPYEHIALPISLIPTFSLDLFHAQKVNVEFSMTTSFFLSKVYSRSWLVGRSKSNASGKFKQG